MKKIIFAHGMESSPDGTKATYLRERFGAESPALFTLGLPGQVSAVQAAIGEGPAVLIGSSLGGLCALGVAANGAPIAHLVLLAPAMGKFEPAAFKEAEQTRPGLYREICEFGKLSISPEIPTTIIHGFEDEVVDTDAVVALAARSPSARLILVHDDHPLSHSGPLILSVVERVTTGLDPVVR
jgi:pimeloyl-ACP methyl ester carboxylesterase